MANYIEALVRERAHYLAQGRDGRAAQVAAELSRLGVEVEDEDEGDGVETTEDTAVRDKGGGQVCEVCGDSFDTARGLAVHRGQKHKEDEDG